MSRSKENRTTKKCMHVTFLIKKHGPLGPEEYCPIEQDRNRVSADERPLDRILSRFLCIKYSSTPIKRQPSRKWIVAS